MPEPQPLILNDASIKISKTALATGLVELACVTNHIELMPDVSTTTLDTMCGSKDYPGTVKWALIATLYQSFDVGATEEVLAAAVAGGVPVAYEVVGYKTPPISATNPAWSGTVVPQPYPPINGDAGDASVIELEWSCVGKPVKRTTPTLLMAFEEMSKAELEQMAADAGLDSSGTKADLIERLTAATEVAA